MSTLKKIFFFSLFILFLSLLFWGIYTLSFKKTELPKNTILPLNNSTPQDLPKTPPASKEKVSIVSQEPVISPTISTAGDKIWYFGASGELKETDLVGGVSKKLTEKKIISLISGIWSLDKSKILLKTNKDSAESYFLFFDIKNDQLTMLNKNITEAFWQAVSSKIIYKYFDSASKKSSLNVSDADGKNWKKILDLPHDKISFSQIPRSGLISFWNNGDAYYPTNFQTVSLLGEDTKSLYKDSFGADYLWDNSGSHVLVSQTDEKGGTKIQLGVMNYNGGEYKNLGLPTFVSKCVWSKDNKTIFCALPGNIPDNSILPNDYTTGKFTTADTFWKIDTVTGEKSRLVETSDMPNTSFDASEFFLNTDESLLFFVNKIDKKLYKIAL
ncbi:MAG: hypothetical protein WC678_02230 [Parcubacteria group bacterium]|jgi:hypothetical protein